MTLIDTPISFPLPTPWVNTQFTLNRLLSLTFLVGPNGSGKSRFAEVLKGGLPGCRLLGTDRLDGMQRNKGFGIFGDNFANGFQKSWFPNFRSFGQNFGSGIDTIPLLAEKLDLRLQVEATLSNLFNRTISLEWDSGSLIPRASLGAGGTSYRLDSEECHGIKELLVMLTHLYDDTNRFLIIDEPELNLHPQFQAFFMEEVRKVAGNPNLELGKKGIILITHSPFMLDFRDVSDLQSVISFSIDHTLPKDMLDLDEVTKQSLSTLVTRINVHHKQLFFSDNPIFVEGIFDAQLIQGIQDARSFSIAASGSCIIEAGGCDEVNKYLLLCQKLGKNAHFVYDLDSLFTGTLRGCIRSDDEVTSFLASLGLGSSFSKYCGALDSTLNRVINDLIKKAPQGPTISLMMDRLISLSEGSDAKSQQRARVAILVQLGRDKDSLEEVLGKTDVEDIVGRLSQITLALQQKNIILLARGALENYLPSYAGNPFRIEDSQKRTVVESEMLYLSTKPSEQDITLRYGGLYKAITLLPAKQQVNFDEHLLPLLSQYILDVQTLTLRRPQISLDQMRAQLASGGTGRERVFELLDLTRGEGVEFSARVLIKASATSPNRHTVVSNLTNAGMRSFSIELGP